MLLYTGPWGDTDKTFKLLPISPECPFNEGIFNAEHNVLAIISKDKKEGHVMLDKLNDDGDKQPIKGRQFETKKVRTTLEKYYEYYITDPKEIIQFINMFAVNSDTFDFQAFFAKEEQGAAAL